jgi:hypothetical protein
VHVDAVLHGAHCSKLLLRWLSQQQQLALGIQTSTDELLLRQLSLFPAPNLQQQYRQLQEYLQQGEQTEGLLLRLQDWQCGIQKGWLDNAWPSIDWLAALNPQALTDTLTYGVSVMRVAVQEQQQALKLPSSGSSGSSGSLRNMGLTAWAAPSFHATCVIFEWLSALSAAVKAAEGLVPVKRRHLQVSSSS